MCVASRNTYFTFLTQSGNDPCHAISERKNLLFHMIGHDNIYTSRQTINLKKYMWITSYNLNNYVQVETNLGNDDSPHPCDRIPLSIHKKVFFFMESKTATLQTTVVNLEAEIKLYSPFLY